MRVVRSWGSGRMVSGLDFFSERGTYDRVRRLPLLAILGALLVVLACSSVAGAQGVAPEGRIDVVQVNGLIDPSNAALISSSIRDAARVRSTVLVFQIDASGAVSTNMGPLVEAMQHSPVPIAVWVGPSGGTARAAGALLTQASGYAGLAPGAHFGPVNPVYYDDTSRPAPPIANPTTPTKGVG